MAWNLPQGDLLDSSYIPALHVERLEDGPMCALSKAGPQFIIKNKAQPLLLEGRGGP